MQRRPCVCAWAIVCLLALCLASNAAAQVNTATLAGTVIDPQGLPVKGAKVTVINSVTAAERSTVADDNGRYNLVGLPPGQYRLMVDGGANFAPFENKAITVTVGRMPRSTPSSNFAACSRASRSPRKQPRSKPPKLKSRKR